MSFVSQSVYFYDGSIYLLTDSVGSWGNALNEANALGGSLVTINNPSESIFLTGVFGSAAPWIGANDAASEGNFTWISGEFSNYSNWNNGPPIGYGADTLDYVQMDFSGRWSAWQGSGSNTVNNRPGIIEISNPNTPTIFIEDVHVIEPLGGTRDAIIKVHLLGTTTNQLIVNYSTSDGSALGGSDYTPTTGSFIFNPSLQRIQTQEIRIPIRGDSDNISGESFFVTLNNTPGTILAKGQAQITIREASEVSINGGSAYILTNSLGSWGTTREEARKLGGDLVTISNSFEQGFVSKYTSAQPWIGLSDVNQEANFTWVNEEPFVYSNWSRQPTASDYGGSSRNFAALDGNSNWGVWQGSGSNSANNRKGLAEIPLTNIAGIDNPLSAPVYRFFNTIAGGHFFTTSEAEKDFVANNLPQYRFEGVGMQAALQDGDDLLPVHRFFNTIAGGHFFTTSVAEKDFVAANLPQYRYEGIGYYAFGAETNLGADVYRFFNTVAGGHFFTTSVGERDLVVANLPQYRYEGIGMEAAFA